MALFGKLFGTSADAPAPAERKDVSAKAVDARLDAAQAASSRGVMARMKSLMGAVKEKTRAVLSYDVGQGAKSAAAFVRDDAAATLRDVKSLGRKALDVGNADVGAYARRAAVAAGLAGAMAAPAAALDEPAAAPMVADAGAKVELVSAPAAASPETANLEAAVALARVSADKGEPVVLAMVDKPMLPQESSTSDFSISKIGTPEDPAFALAQKYGVSRNGNNPVALGAAPLQEMIDKSQLPKEFASYFDYVRELSRLENSGKPEDKAAYLRLVRERGVVSVNVYEGSFASSAYPDTVVDEYNGKGRYLMDISAIKVGLVPSAVKASLASYFTDGYTDAYAREQFNLGNPAYAGKDGAYDPSVIQAKLASQQALVGRWEKRFDQMDQMTSQGRKVSDVAAGALNALHQVYVFGNNVPLNRFAVEQERTAALSIAAIYNAVKLDEKGNLVGNGAKYLGKPGTRADGLPNGVNPTLLAGDEAKIAIAAAARSVKGFPLTSGQLREVAVLEVVRCKDPDALLAKAHELLGKGFEELYAQVPAGFEKGSSEHKTKALRLIAADPEGFAKDLPKEKADAVRAFAREVRGNFATSYRLPLIDDKVKASVPALLGVLAAAGTPERAAQDRLSADLNAKAYADAVAEFNLANELRYAEASEGLRVASQDLAKNEKELAAEKAAAAAAAAELASTKEAVALFKKWEEAPAAEKAKIAEELRPKVKTLLDAELARAKPDEKAVAVLKYYLSKLS